MGTQTSAELTVCSHTNAHVVADRMSVGIPPPPPTLWGTDASFKFPGESVYSPQLTGSGTVVWPGSPAGRVPYPALDRTRVDVDIQHSTPQSPFASPTIRRAVLEVGRAARDTAAQARQARLDTLRKRLEDVATEVTVRPCGHGWGECPRVDDPVCVCARVCHAVD